MNLNKSYMNKIALAPLALFIGGMAPEQLLIGVLLLVTVIDFVTGVSASYVTKYKKGAPLSVYIFQSARARTSLVKGGAYMLFIMVSWLFCFIFKVENISLFGFAIPIVTASIALPILIEVHSTFENLNKCGFDFYGTVKNLFLSILKMIKFAKKEVEDAKK